MIMKSKEEFGQAGHHDEREGHTCDQCGCYIGDYVKYAGIKRCVGCWVEFEMNVLYENKHE